MHDARQSGQRAAATLHGKDDGVEPGAGDAADRAVSGDGEEVEPKDVPAATLSEPVHAERTSNCWPKWMRPMRR